MTPSVATQRDMGETVEDVLAAMRASSPQLARLADRIASALSAPVAASPPALEGMAVAWGYVHTLPDGRWKVTKGSQHGAGFDAWAAETMPLYASPTPTQQAVTDGDSLDGVLAVMACAVQDLDVSGRTELAKQLNEAYFTVAALIGEHFDLGRAAGMLSVDRAEFRIGLAKLTTAARRVTDAFKAHGKARQSVDNLVTRRECEASMAALDAALNPPAASNAAEQEVG